MRLSTSKAAAMSEPDANGEVVLPLPDPVEPFPSRPSREQIQPDSRTTTPGPRQPGLDRERDDATPLVRPCGNRVEPGRDLAE